MEFLKIVAFKLGDEEFGLNIDHVHSIERFQHITRVPNAPAYVQGVMNLRGQVIPIIDLRKMLDQGHAEFSESTRVIITKYEEINLGFIVDQTSDVIDVSPEEIDAASTCGLDMNYLGGVAKIDGRLIMLLKLHELMQATTN